MGDLNFGLQVAVGVLSGAVGGWLSNFGYEVYKRQKATESLEFVTEPRDGIFINARVVNHSDVTIKNCWVYISIDHTQNDILLPTQNVTIGPGSTRPVTEDRLCWSLIDNPPNVDILPQESQRLFIGFVSQSFQWIGFSSEKGMNPARIYLQTTRSYPVVFKIVSESTTGVVYKAIVDPSDPVRPIKNLSRQ